MFRFGMRKRNVSREVKGRAPRRKELVRNIAKEEGKTGPAWMRNIDWERARLRVVVMIFSLLWAGLWGRAWYLQMIEGPRLADRARRQHMASELVTGRRGMIFDRNGKVLACSVEARSVYARPQEITDCRSAADKLASILGMNPQKIYAEISGKRRFVWLKRKVNDYTAKAVQQADIPGIGLSKEYDRVYPFKHMAGQLLGFVGMDDKGLEGIERSLDARLGCMPTRQIVQRDAMGRKFYLHEDGQGEPVGEDLTLTIDIQMQFFVEEAVARTVREFDARWGGALVVDIASGDILAWAQYPFFNPNTYKEFSPIIYRNRLAADALEPGSTFKPFVMAAALQERKVSPTTLINCEGGKWEYKKVTIRDTSQQKMITAAKVLRYSSNIGMAKIGMMLGVQTFHKYLHALGFGQRTGVPVAESRGILRPPRAWSEADLMTTSFGQSISVTGLQMAQAYLILLNNGLYKPLRLLREDSAVSEAHPRIFSATTTKAIVTMMHDVVAAKDGTGRRARVEGLDVGGKTGTAQKADHRSRTYGSKRLASFVGFFPVDKPRYFILVMVDEPTRNQYGGVVAAPVFQDVATRMVTYTGMLNETHVANAEKDDSRESSSKKRQRGLKLAGMLIPYQTDMPKPRILRAPEGMNLPGHLAKAGSRVPDVMGKTVRNAVELFARAGVVPELKGTGTRVVRQIPAPGTVWPEERKSAEYILWLSER
ncbi:MAG: PASTA domain-containing protein [Desulfovibrio sp.]|nr:PASTA domain-containing protein [Desulfovibrio sp.]